MLPGKNQTPGKSATNPEEERFYKTLQENTHAITSLYDALYKNHPGHRQGFSQLLGILETAFANRSSRLKERDANKRKSREAQWFLSNTLCGMSLYVDRFCSTISKLENKLDYFNTLGVNLLHLMPLFESPAHESDGGYAVSNFRKIDERFGKLEDLEALQQSMLQQDMYLMLDIVLNHTSNRHDWALKARQGDKKYQDYFYFFDNRQLPDSYEQTMPEIFPESSPGNFTYVPELDKWVMTVFHHYQWDLNYRNPAVFNEMLDNIFFYANLGVDILRIDAPAFIWKQEGTKSQNLAKAHSILQLIKLCVQISTPGMALLGEAIVSPVEIMKYFGTGPYYAKECDLAYNATQMALQWDALATADTRIMLAAQDPLLQKPYGSSWITYTRCHDDIGLGYDDWIIQQTGYNSFEHRSFIKNYYTGNYPGSLATGALFSVNEKTGDARISGSLASLCGLEKALEQNEPVAIDKSLRKIILMQAHSFFIGGIPMLFYGDEQGYTNDYSYKSDPDKNYDNRWMHRPVIDWERNDLACRAATTENNIFALTKKLIAIRRSLPVVADKKNLTWINTINQYVCGYLRAWENDRVYCIFNFSDLFTSLHWNTFKKNGMQPVKLYDHWGGKLYPVGKDHEQLSLQPYQFLLLEPR
jgi:amylosucrase